MYNHNGKLNLRSLQSDLNCAGEGEFQIEKGRLFNSMGPADGPGTIAIGYRAV